MTCSPRDRLAGQSSVEYLVGCVLVLALLWADAASGQSALMRLLQAVEAGFQRFASALSLA